MTMSPSSAGAVAARCTAGNESTLVGLSCPRQSRLSFWMAASSVSTTLTSPLAAGRPDTTAAAVAIARRGVAPGRAGAGRRAGAVVGFDDARHELVTDDVLRREHHVPNAFDL